MAAAISMLQDKSTFRGLGLDKNISWNIMSIFGDNWFAV
jgi:hypothetical protein